MMQTREICHVGRCPRGCQEVCQRAVEITDVSDAARHHRVNADKTSAEIAFKAGAEWMASRRDQVDKTADLQRQLIDKTVELQAFEAAHRELLARQVPEKVFIPNTVRVTGVEEVRGGAVHVTVNAVDMPSSGSEEAREAIDEMLIRFGHPFFPNDAARAGWMAARKWMRDKLKSSTAATN